MNSEPTATTTTARQIRAILTMRGILTTVFAHKRLICCSGVRTLVWIITLPPLVSCLPSLACIAHGLYIPVTICWPFYTVPSQVQVRFPVTRRLAWRQ